MKNKIVKYANNSVINDSNDRRKENNKTIF